MLGYICGYMSQLLDLVTQMHGNEAVKNIIYMQHRCGDDGTLACERMQIRRIF